MCYRCFNCNRLWTYLIGDGCMACGYPCEVIVDNGLDAQLSSTYGSASTNNNSTDEGLNPISEPSDDIVKKSISAKLDESDEPQALLPMHHTNLVAATKESQVDNKPFFEFTAGEKGFSSTKSLKATPSVQEAFNPFNVPARTSANRGTTASSSHGAADGLQTGDSWAERFRQLSERAKKLAERRAEFEQESVSSDSNEHGTGAGFAISPVDVINPTEGHQLSPSIVQPVAPILPVTLSNDPIQLQHTIQTVSLVTSKKNKKKKKKNKKSTRQPGDLNLATEVAPKPTVQLELPAPIPPPTPLLAEQAWSDVVAKKQIKQVKAFEAAAKAGRPVNASSYLFTQVNDENESPKQAVAVKVGYRGAKHEARMVVPRDAIE